jgi:hypothetical protein
MLQRSESDRQVLNREPRRIEHGRVVVAAASLGVAGEHRAELCDVFTCELPDLERMEEFPVVTRLLSVMNKQKIMGCCSEAFAVYRSLGG